MSADPPFDHFGGLSLTLLARSSSAWNKQPQPKVIMSPRPGGTPDNGSVYFIYLFFYNLQYTEKTAKGEGKQKEYSSLLLASHMSGNSMGRGPPPPPPIEEEKTLGRSELWLLRKGELLSQHIYTVSPLSF